MIVVSDSSPLIFMVRIGSLEILRSLYKTVLIPKAVFDEAVNRGKDEGYGDAFLIEKDVGSLIIVKNLRDKFSNQLKTLVKTYGKGESEAVVLCLQENADLLLADDHDTRKLAEIHNIRWLSTLGILFTALKKGLIGLDMYIKKIGELSKYAWLSGDVIAKFLQAGYDLKGGNLWRG